MAVMTTARIADENRMFFIKFSFFEKCGVAKISFHNILYRRQEKYYLREGILSKALYFLRDMVYNIRRKKRRFGGQYGKRLLLYGA